MLESMPGQQVGADAGPAAFQPPVRTAARRSAVRRRRWRPPRRPGAGRRPGRPPGRASASASSAAASASSTKRSTAAGLGARQHLERVDRRARCRPPPASRRPGGPRAGGTRPERPAQQRVEDLVGLAAHRRDQADAGDGRRRAGFTGAASAPRRRWRSRSSDLADLAGRAERDVARRATTTHVAHASRPTSRRQRGRDRPWSRSRSGSAPARELQQHVGDHPAAVAHRDHRAVEDVRAGGQHPSPRTSRCTAAGRRRGRPSRPRGPGGSSSPPRRGTSGHR